MSLTSLTLLCKTVFTRSEMFVRLTHACLMIRCCSSYLIAVGHVSYCGNAGVEQRPPRLLQVFLKVVVNLKLFLWRIVNDAVPWMALLAIILSLGEVCALISTSLLEFFWLPQGCLKIGHDCVVPYLSCFNIHNVPSFHCCIIYRPVS